MRVEPVGPRPGDTRGFIHKRLGRLAKGALTVASSAGIPFISGGAGVVRSMFSGGSRNPAFVGARAAQEARFQQSRFSRGRGPIETVAEARKFAQGFSPQPSADGQCPRGFHLNKSTYRELKSGNLVPERSKCVKNRSRNPDNGKAALRAARRLMSRKDHQARIDKALAGIGPKRRSAPKTKVVTTGPHGHT